MRIIAGVAKGRTLKTVRGYDIRPTPEKVRESLFQRFGDLRGKRFLDGFAGSGAVGIEALSRGASRVVFVDSDRRACQCIEENLRRAGFWDHNGWKTLPMTSKAGARARVVFGYHETDGRRWDRLSMTVTEAIPYLEKQEEKEVFDFIFLDPPYQSEAGLVVLKRLVGSPLVGAGCRLFWEHAAREWSGLAESTGWRVIDTRRFGDTEVTELTCSG